MCGIAGIIVINKNGFNAVDKIVSLSKAIEHRGPDGEGYFLKRGNIQNTCYGNLSQSNSNAAIPYAPVDHILNYKQQNDAELILAHRRLSIIDLSAKGHQPMCDQTSKYWITYNGELYNYVELKAELINLGFHFHSETDTEVVIAAYQAWGPDCTSRFNGMWAFCLYDSTNNTCFLSRDRLGVKPLYYYQNNNAFVFASEQKAMVKAGFIKANYTNEAVSNYLLHELIEYETDNFFHGINELWPGHQMVYQLQTHSFSIHAYYHISTHQNLNNNGLSDRELIEKTEQLLENAIRIRLRSDVEVGTCLSGGIDSSVIAAMMAKLNHNKIFCFTAVFKNNPISEEYFADIVNKHIQSHALKIEPGLDGFLNEVDELIYSQDAPIWNTSTYAQHKVMSLAKQSGIKVVLDGQGADELFAGYHHHFLAKWQNMINQGHYIKASIEINKSRKTIPHPFVFFAKEKIKQHFNFKQQQQSQILKSDFIESNTAQKNLPHDAVNDALLDDIYRTRLKTFLKCEDRCGMWHSVESRTPFSDDIELINFMFSFDGNRKIQNGVSKYLLREACKPILPNEIYRRYDKVGFETPMQNWMKKIHPQVIQEIQSANFDFVNYTAFQKTDPNNVNQNKLLFKLFVLSKWQKTFS